MTTLAATLEAALNGQATPADVVKACDAELSGKVTILAENAVKAVNKVYSPASKIPKNLKTLPIMYTLRLSCKDGYLVVSNIFVKDDEFQSESENIPARIENEFSLLVPARPFRDWLRVTQHVNQLKIWTGKEGKRDCLYIQADATRTMFYCLSADEFPAVN